MRSWRREFLSMALVMAVPVALVAFFPYSAIGFRAFEVPSTSPAAASFVTLTLDEERAALSAARTTWQTDVSVVRRKRMRLPLGELPAETKGTVLLGLAEPVAVPAGDPVEYGIAAWRPSEAASAPSRISPSSATAVARPVFSRGELLGLKEREASK